MMPVATMRRVVVRWCMLALAMATVFLFGVSSAYSGLRVADQRMIRIAYANGYKDALEYAFRSERTTLDQLRGNPDRFKEQVLNAADGYVEKVSSLN